MSTVDDLTNKLENDKGAREAFYTDAVELFKKHGVDLGNPDIKKRLGMEGLDLNNPMAFKKAMMTTNIITVGGG